MSPNSTNSTLSEHIEVTFITSPTISLIQLIVSGIGIIANIVVLLSSALKVVNVTPFVILLLNLSVADILMARNIYLEHFVDEKELHGADSSLTGLICSVFHEIDLYYLGALNNVITMVYISFCRTSIFSSSEIFQQQTLSQKKVLRFIFLTWLVTTVIMAPNSFIFALDKEKGCWTKYQFFYMIYGAVLGFGVYMTCFVIVSINFIRAMVALKERRSFHQSVLSKKGKQIKIIFVSLLAIYVCFSTPLAIKLLLRASGILDAKQDLMMSHITLTISLLTTITDPCIYIFSWSGFHNGLRKQISNGIPRQ